MNATATQNQTEGQNRGNGQDHGEAQIQRAENRVERGFVTPRANISAAGNEYVVELDMPGVETEGLEITVEGNELTIIGRRRFDLPEGEVCYCESPQADYRRVFELGSDVDTSRISAEMHQGVLKLHLPKSERAMPKRIEVKLA